MEIAKVTGEAVQNEINDGNFVVERDQLYFALKSDSGEYLLGLSDILRCLKVAEKIGELPELPKGWWTSVRILYGDQA